MTDIEMVKVAVDQDVCIGAGQCEVLEEETFLIDDETVIADVIGTGVLPRDRAQAAADACPSGAIFIVETALDEAPSSEDE